MVWKPAMLVKYAATASSWSVNLNWRRISKSYFDIRNGAEYQNLTIEILF